jgi:hypothetical protein
MLRLQRVLGFASHQTAWAWLPRSRRAMAIPGRELLAGAVKVDESYFGARLPGAAGRAVSGEPIVAIGVEDRGEASGHVHMRRIPEVTKATLTAFVLNTSPAVPRCAPMAVRATSTSAATPSCTWSRTRRPQATPTWPCRTSTASLRWSSAGCSARTRARSAPTSSTTTSAEPPILRVHSMRATLSHRAERKHRPNKPGGCSRVGHVPSARAELDDTEPRPRATSSFEGSRQAWGLTVDTGVETCSYGRQCGLFFQSAFVPAAGLPLWLNLQRTPSSGSARLGGSALAACRSPAQPSA